VDDRLAELERRVVEQVPRGEVVGAVDDEIVVGEERHDVLRRHAQLVRDHGHVGVERGERLLRALDLRRAHAILRVDDLALQVRDVDHVVVDEPDGADARRREVDRRGRPQPARADEQHARLQELHLTGLADLGEHGVARVADLLIRRHHERDLEGQAGALPGAETTGEAVDVLVAELTQRAGGERRAGPARTVEDHAARLVRDLVFDPLLEEPARDPARVGDEALDVFVLLAHVDDRGVLGLAELADVDLVDLALDFFEVALEVRHGSHGV
jgi:hypothetical protein